MSQHLLINAALHEIRVCVVENGMPQELHVERTIQRGLVGNIYIGKVVRVLPSMQAAFVDIGLSRNAFLHISDILLPSAAAAHIEHVLHDGQLLRVQVIKDPIGSKGIRLSTKLTYVARLLILLPHDNTVYFSQRVAGEVAREHLLETISRYTQDTPLAKMGFIVRSKITMAAEEELVYDLQYLLKIYQEIASITKNRPGLLFCDLDLAQRALRDMVSVDTVSIKIDAVDKWHALQEFAQNYIPHIAPRLEHHKDERSIFDLFAIEDEINRALEKRVELKSGGYLVFDEAEAMTVVDVNSGALVSGRNMADIAYKTNLEAVYAICRQLRLRNIGGVVVVDFIDMEQAEQRQRILSALREQLARDAVKTKVSEFSYRGLVEITRQRTRESLAQQLCVSCPTCGGRGILKSVRTICYEILREIAQEARQFNPAAFRLVAAPAVIDGFLEEEATFFNHLSSQVGKDIHLHADSGYAPEEYDIILV